MAKDHQIRPCQLRPYHPLPESHLLKAGEALSVLTPAGSWPDVLLHNQYMSYRFASNVSESIPADSIVSVPGAEFPSFIEVAIPHVKQIEKMTISLGQQEYLGRETILRWQPGTDPNAYI